MARSQRHQDAGLRRVGVQQGAAAGHQLGIVGVARRVGRAARGDKTYGRVDAVWFGFRYRDPPNAQPRRPPQRAVEAGSVREAVRRVVRLPRQDAACPSGP